MKILILGGGDSPEREVSLRSASSVAEAARTAGYDVIEADPKYEMEILDNLPADTVVLPILHGKNGEDGVLQAELEKRGLKYLGSNSQVSRACFDKWQTRSDLTAAGLPMPAAALVDQQAYRSSELSKKPHVLKILHGGSSIGTLIVNEPKNISEAAIDEIFAMENRAVLEQLIVGTEITVPILDKDALPVIEIVPPQDEEFDYENKYNGRTQELCPPKSVSGDLQFKAQRLAEKVHATMGARHLSRVDMMIDENGELYILEINTMPGMTEASLYPKSAAVSGLTMPQLVTKFVELVSKT